MRCVGEGCVLIDSVGMTGLSAAVRALAAAGKSLRLYPASSPIPRESIATALDALSEYFVTGQVDLVLSVSRDGLVWQGEVLHASSASMSELVQELQDHTVAKVEIDPGVTEDELIAFLSAVGRAPEDVRAEGGLNAILSAAGAQAVRVTDVQLTTVEQVIEFDGEDIDEFLRQLAADPERLAAWFGAAACGDPAAFADGLMELVRVAGPSGYQALVAGVANAFATQSTDARDGLLLLSLDVGPVSDFAADMFGLLNPAEIAGSVLGGVLGKNMLSLSHALSRLPLERVTAEVRAEVQAMLPGAGRTTDEADFLNHMLEVRESESPEPSLVDADRSYRAVADVANLPEETVDRARAAVLGSQKAISAVGVRTMISLLDQQQNYELYIRTVESLAAMVPKLIAQGDLALAGRVLTELSDREQAESNPWPELSARISDVRAQATGPETMAALLDAVAHDESVLPDARTIVSQAGGAGTRVLVSQALTLKSDGLRIADKLVGRRTLDVLNDLASQAEWHELAPIAARLLSEDDPRSVATVDAMMARSDQQSRREVIMGASSNGGPRAMQLCARALKDPAAEVAIAATRALARSGTSEAAAQIAARLDELDLDTADFAIAREMIVALTHLPGPEADMALTKIAGRRTLIKRGHFADVQELVAKTQRLRAGAGQN